MPQIFQWSMMAAVQNGQELPAGSILHFDKALLYNVGFQWLNLIVLIGLLVFLLYKPVKKFMRERAERIQAQIDHARADVRSAEKLKAEYEALVRGIEKEREEILRQTYKKATEKSDQIIAQARKEAEHIYNRSLADLRLEQENMADEMRRQIVEIATLMAAHFVEVSVDRDTHDKFIDEALAELEAGA